RSVPPAPSSSAPSPPPSSPDDGAPTVDLRPLLWTLALCVLASFVTPYGLAAVALPGKLLARIVPAGGNLFSTAVAENVPPFILERTAPEQAAYFKWLLAGL